MKITIISASEGGGAGYSSKNLYQGFLNIGVDASFLTVGDLYKERLNIFSRTCRWWLVRKNIKENFSYLKAAPAGYDYFTFPKTGYINLHKHPLIKDADVINVHWISSMIDYPSFFKNIDKPIIWTLHDTNPFTGGCHYTFHCDHYLNDCANCIQLSEKVRGFAAKNSLQIKQESLSTLDPRQTIVISPSEWLKSVSEKSSLFRQYRHFCVPYGIDTTIFRRYKIIESRNKLQLPLDKFIVLFVGTSINEHRKGFDIILKLKEILKERNDILFVAVGKSNDDYDGILNIGYIKEKEQIANAYSAANVFLIPSREDNLPNTMLEALCCGTPVIGYKTGGIIDAISHGVNGFLIDKEDTTNIAEYIIQMINVPDMFNREYISKCAAENYALEKQAHAYQKIINEVLINKLNDEGLG